MAVAVETSFGQQCDSNGVPVSGALIYVYDAGTTTARSVYSDTALSVAAANPIVCDASGRHDMRYISALAYKIVVKTSAGVTVYTRDNIDPGVPIGTGVLAIANGGTGASDPATALVNLGAATTAQITTLSEEVAEIAGAVGSTASTKIATGTTAQRPSSDLAEGMIRRNTTTHRTEGYNNQGQWEQYLTDTEIATQSEMETATSTEKVVTPGRQHYHPGMAKAWAVVTVSGGTPSLTAAYNIASIQDLGVGNYRLVFANAMSSTAYAVIVTKFSMNIVGDILCSSRATTSFDVYSLCVAGQSDATPVANDSSFMVVVYGDI